jgi:DNA repair exonuclease SbcCD ATPase subunit
VTQPSTSPSPVQDLDSLRQIVFGAESARLEERIGAVERAANAELHDLERRVGDRLDDLGNRMTAQQAEVARLQQEHAERVTQMLDQMLAQLGHRLDTLVAETRERLDALQQRATDLERRKLNVVDFGGTLATLGQRFSGDEARPLFRAG